MWLVLSQAKGRRKVIKKMFKAVIFDRDGVLLDSEAINIQSAIETFKEFGISVKKTEIEQIIGRHPKDFTKFFLKKHQFSFDDFFEKFRKRYYELLESVSFFDNMIKLIHDLHKKKIPLAITTSSSRKGTNLVLEKAKLNNIFDVVVTSDDYVNRKPNPEPYLVTAKKLGVNPKDCIVFEDTSVGVEAAKKAGMKCIAIPNEYTKHQNFSEADKVVTQKEVDIKILDSF